MLVLLGQRPFGLVALGTVAWLVAPALRLLFSFSVFANPWQNVEVPGGQQIYIAPNGAVAYTQAHSGVTPPGSQFSGFSVNDGKLTFAGEGFLACPSADNSSAHQLYVQYGQLQVSPECYVVELVTASGNEPGFAAWQYT